MNKKSQKEWEKACKKEQELRGYVKAETLFIPILSEMIDDGIITVHQSKEFTTIMSQMKNRDAIKYELYNNQEEE